MKWAGLSILMTPPNSSPKLREAVVPDLFGPQADGSPESRPPNINRYQMDSEPQG